MRVPAPGRRAARVLIKIEDSTSGGVGAGDVASGPRRARLPPGSYAVEGESDDDYEEEDEEEDEEEEEEENNDDDDDEVMEEEGEDKDEGNNNVSGGAGSGKPDDQRSSQVAGVSWFPRDGNWRARHWVNGKHIHLGHHATEEAAALAVHEYAKDHGVGAVNRRGVRTSRFRGVTWDKCGGKWKAACKGKTVGRYATEEAAARAYSKEAERVGLNVIPIVGNGDHGSTTNAAATSAAAATAAAAAAAALAPPSSAAHARACGRGLQARRTNHPGAPALPGEDAAA